MTYLERATLADDPEFVSRVRMAMLDAATDVYSENTATQYHAQRGDLAINVVRDPNRWLAAFLPVVLAETTTLTSGSSDADLKSAVAAVWNVMAGIVIT